MRARKKINEVMPNLMVDGGIFKELSIVSKLSMTAPQLGIAYNFRSGQKSINSLINHYLGDNEILGSSSEILIGTMINNYYGDKWDKIVETLLLEYNPIENYDRKEDGTDKKTGTETNLMGSQTNGSTIGSQTNNSTIGEQTNDSTIGQQQNSHSVGQQQNSSVIGGVTVTDNFGKSDTTTTYGEQENTTENGAVTVTDTMGSQTVIDVKKVVAFDNTEMTATEEHDITNGAHTDTHGTSANTVTNTIGERMDTVSVDEHIDTHQTTQQSNSETLGARSDSDTFGERTDSQTIGERTDSQTIGARTDSQTLGEHTDTLTHDTTDTHNLRVHGNIGVTTTQQMILSEIDLRNYNLLETIFKDIDNFIALKVYA